MYFMTIVKRRNKDLWLVLQGLRLPKDAGETWNVVYKGPGSIEIARFIVPCFNTYLTTKPKKWKGPYVDPICEAFGFKSGRGIAYHTLTLDVHVDLDTDHVKGTLMDFSYSHALGIIEFADHPGEMDEPKWDRLAWKKIKHAFDYAEGL